MELEHIRDNGGNILKKKYNIFKEFTNLFKHFTTI